MNNQTNGGMSARSLVLLGAFAALALNRDLRRGLLEGTRDAARSAQDTYAETVRPAIGHTLETLREEGPQWFEQAQGRAEYIAHLAAERAAQLRDEAEDAAGQLQRDYRREYAPKLRGLLSDVQGRAGDWREDAEDALVQSRKGARKALATASKRGASLLSEVQDQASQWISHAEDALEEGRRDAERQLNQARRKAQKDLRRANKNWDADKLEREVSKRIAPLHKQLSRNLAQLEKEADKRRRALKGESHSSGLGGGTAVALALGAGLVVLARMPEARKAVLDAIDSVSPDAAKTLHQYSRQARDLLGSAWIESIEEEKPAATTPAPGTGTQAGTTGATAAGATAPDSSAEKGVSTSPAPRPSDVQGGTQTQGQGSTLGKTEIKPSSEKIQTSPMTDSFLKKQGDDKNDTSKKLS